MTQLEVTFLGTTAGIPTKTRNHAALYVTYRSEQEYSCLFDCGEGTQRQILMSGDLNFMRIDDIFITHWHADHYAGLLGLMETMNLEGRTRDLTIFAPEATKFVEILLELGYASKRFDVLAVDVPHEGREISIAKDDEEFQILSIPVKHSIPAVAFAFAEKDRVKIDKAKAKKIGLPEKGLIFKRIKEKGSVEFGGRKILLDDICIIEPGKRFVYTGDTMASQNIVEISRNADLLIHDSTFFNEEDEKKRRHATVDDVLRLFGESRAKQLVLTHISRRYQDMDELKEKIAGLHNVSIAKDFMKVVLK